MNKPDYNALLRSFWSSPTLTESVEDNTKNEVEGDITDFLAESILWQETVPYKLPDQQPMPDNLPPELIAALQRNGITQLYSHQLSALLALRKGKDVIITTATASGKTLSAYPAILEGCLNKGHTAISFYSLKALALDQFNKISTLLAGIPQASRPKLAIDISKIEPFCGKRV